MGPSSLGVNMVAIYWFGELFRSISRSDHTKNTLPASYVGCDCEHRLVRYPYNLFSYTQGVWVPHFGKR